MRILTRYIFKEVFTHSLLGLLVFTFVIFVRHVSHLLEIVVRHNLPPRSVAALFLLPFPSILVLTIPMSVLVGILIGLSRMSADGEVIAARASGIGLWQFIRPVMMMAFVAWAVALGMSLFLSPQSLRRLHRMEQEITTSEVPYEIQPRVFIEQFPNLLLYLQDVTGSRSQWKGVFIADMTKRDAPKVTLAERGMLVNDAANHRLTLHLEEGTTHETDPTHPERYSIGLFTDTDIPIPIERSEGAVEDWRAPPALPLQSLLNPSGDDAEKLAARVELHYRFALPVASLVLALVGIPLGLSTRKGGKAVGVVLTILLVFVYYVLMAFGLGFAKQGRLSPVLGLWTANAVFALVGFAMFSSLRTLRHRIQAVQDWLVEAWQKLRRPHQPKPVELHRQESGLVGDPRAPGDRLLQILDLYVLRGWTFYFLLLLATFCGIFVIFDFFQILGDVVRNHIPALVVFNYYRYLLPQVIYLMLPLAVLVATLVNFGLLTKTNQMTAIRSAGVSIYRASLPILIVAAALSAGMYLLGDYTLPETNQRQDALRNQIKGKPAQTYYRPDRQWIFGQGERIFNYRFFDPDRNVFADLSIFEFDARTLRMKRRIYAGRAFWEPPIRGWVLENGWVRDLDADRVKDYMPFSVAKFDELTEEPAYFKKEVKASAQMSALELKHYINELAQSGFDVVRLSVQLYRKFSFPLIAFVVALIGIPFSLTTGSRGALSGIALSIGIAIVYWSISSLFEAMGNLNQLPPIVAAWSPDLLFGLGGVYLLLRVRT
ncbi:MAG: LPS export ABC transporter permease LptF [Terriglobia bacterium]|jgi:LPS export ABC transporter permease LptF/LPS export ABC transporter permease LptG